MKYTSAIILFILSGIKRLSMALLHWELSQSHILQLYFRMLILVHEQQPSMHKQTTSRHIAFISIFRPAAERPHLCIASLLQASSSTIDFQPSWSSRWLSKYSWKATVLCQTLHKPTLLMKEYGVQRQNSQPFSPCHSNRHKIRNYYHAICYALWWADRRNTGLRVHTLRRQMKTVTF